jgi:hypothetical protein
MTESNNTTCCIQCGKVKTPETCYRNKNRPDGYNAYCKECHKAKAASTYLKHKAKRQVTAKADYQKNADEYKARAKKWAEANKEKRREISKAYVKRNPETRHETSKKHRLENPGMYAEHFKMRQTRKRKAMPTWADRDAIKALYRQSAFATRMTGIEYHVDHYFPLKSDVVCGLHNEFNLRIVPATVNLSKANKMPSEN